MSTRRSLLHSCALVTAFLVACGGDGGTEPTGPRTMVKVEGDQQTGVVGEALSVDPTVEVRDADDEPLSGVSVEFEVTSGGGTVASSTVTTDSQGRASTTWTLGTSTAQSQSLEASAGSATATFSAEPQAGPATAVEIVSGNDQEVPEPGTELPDPLVVEVSDAHGNPVPGAAVQFTTDDGNVSPSDATTDGAGRAQTTATVGSESELGATAIVPSSLTRARVTVLYEEQLRAVRAAVFTATVSQVEPVDFSAAVTESTATTAWSTPDSPPPEMSLSADGTLSGVPNSGTVGDHTFTVEASDGGSAIASREYTLTVCDPPAPARPGRERSRRSSVQRNVRVLPSRRLVG